MNTDEIKIMINKYFDGEMEKGSEPILFTQLSLDEEAREYFKSMNSIKEVLQDDIKEFPFQLEERILYSIDEKINMKPTFAFWKNPFAIVSYGFATVLLIFSIFFYTQSLDYKKELEVTVKQVNQQNQMINVLINSLPMTEVVGRVDGEILIENTSL